MKKILILLIGLILFSNITFANNIKTLQQQAQKGDAKAQAKLSLLYFVGKGVKKDLLPDTFKSAPSD